MDLGRELLNCLKAFPDTEDSDLFFGGFCFPTSAHLQFGPFLDAKHEQVEVSAWGGEGRRGEGLGACTHLDTLS